MILAVDVGNTRIKAAAFEEDSLVRHFAFPKEEVQKKITEILNEFTFSAIVIASVTDLEKDFFLLLAGTTPVHFISRDDRFPFSNHYGTPDTLGIDRMVLAAGAVLQYPAQNRLVIDAGTCITYDFIDADDRYLGGAISPGIGLRYKSLHDYTAKLPALDPEMPPDFIGKSTASSIHVGISEGVVHEIKGFVAQYQGRYPNFIIILTGGDTDFLAVRLKNTIFAHSNFLLESLNRTYIYSQT